MSNVEKLLAEMLVELQAIRIAQEDIQRDMAETFAIKRKLLNKKTREYIEFEEFVLEKGKNIFSIMIIGKYKVCKQTALNWIARFAHDHANDGWKVSPGSSQQPTLLYKKVLR